MMNICGNKQLHISINLMLISIKEYLSILRSSGILIKFSVFISDNLILTEDHKTVKLADFGLAREESLTEMMTAETGTYRWMAPEVLLNCQKLNNLLIFQFGDPC